MTFKTAKAYQITYKPDEFGSIETSTFYTKTYNQAKKYIKELREKDKEKMIAWITFSGSIYLGNKEYFEEDGLIYFL